MSNTYPITAGVLQGSVFRPILYLIYTADLTKTSAEYPFSYCDPDRGEEEVISKVVWREFTRVYISRFQNSILPSTGEKGMISVAYHSIALQNTHSENSAFPALYR